MASLLRYHLDENVTTALASALRLRGIDVTTTDDVGLLGASDTEQLDFAQRDCRVLVTRDHDLLALASQGVEHASIVYWPPTHRDLRETIESKSIVRHGVPDLLAGRARQTGFVGGGGPVGWIVA
jgi:uncharacterized protein with PIN domain